jgi:NAD(P)-dependent dehydrogenase (short-subunit alcohol dehydrogenase family)
MTPLQGRRALVTGANRGLGKLIATSLADHGCDLILHGRTEGSCADLAETLATKAIAVSTVAADLASPDDVDSLLQTLAVSEPGIDVVFNNAGLQVAYRQDFYATPRSDFDISFQVNCTAPAMICHRLLPPMLERGFGRIINVTSGIAFEPQQAGYSASKAALDKFSIDLASAIDHPNVLLNLVDPGWCRTDLGGPDAPHDPLDALAGMLVGAFIDDGQSGRIFRAQDFTGLTMKEAVARAKA